MDGQEKIHGSFRDPSGFVFRHGQDVFRQVNDCYQEHFDLLMGSGLYQRLADAGLLILHQVVDQDPPKPAYKIVKPEQIDFISYPYEWCFSELKDAALTTLTIQKIAMEFGMSLKDASAYNIQFQHGRPILIDTLSFEKMREGKPWVAYRQFCQHFLAPLALMSQGDARLSQLLQTNIDGIPLDLASRLLPAKSWLAFSLLSHIHLHARAQKHFADSEKTSVPKSEHFSKTAFLGLIDSLESAVRGLTWKPKGTEWAEYYDFTNYGSASVQHKKEIVQSFLAQINPKRVWDLGANDGTYSRIASGMGIPTIASDIDPAAVEKGYLAAKQAGEKNLLFLQIDLINPSPGLGWANTERDSLVARGPVDAVLALALIHHLAISNNVPLPQIAEFFASLGRHLIIEFVPKSDSKVKKLLSTREDIFDNYTQDGFEKAFSQFFQIISAQQIRESERTIYLMKAYGETH